jgi:hypothetical protein
LDIFWRYVYQITNRQNQRIDRERYTFSFTPPTQNRLTDIKIYFYLIDQKLLDEKIETSRELMKQNASKIHQMEGKKDLHGFNLSGITATDLYNNINVSM